MRKVDLGSHTVGTLIRREDYLVSPTDPARLSTNAMAVVSRKFDRTVERTRGNDERRDAKARRGNKGGRQGREKMTNSGGKQRGEEDIPWPCGTVIVSFRHTYCTAS